MTRSHDYLCNAAAPLARLGQRIGAIASSGNNYCRTFGIDSMQCTVVREGLSTYWANSRRVGDRQGHWIRRSEDIHSYTVSKSVDSLGNARTSVPAML